MRLLSQKDVAEMLQVSLSTLSRMCSSGDLPHIVLRAGKRKRVIRFRLDEIEKWLASRTHAGPESERPIRKRGRNGNGLATAKTMKLQVHEVERENREGHRFEQPVSGV